MLRGLLKAIDPQQMELLHCGAMTVLEQTGLQIQGEFLLRALADAGCRVDFAARRAWFKPDLVERQVVAQRGRYRMVRSSLWYPFCRDLPAEDVAIPESFVCDYGFATPHIYDYPSGEFRRPTVQDQIEMIRLGEGLPCVRAVCAPLICGDTDPRVEILESSRLLLRHCTKPGWVGTSRAAEVKYLAELSALATGDDERLRRTQPPIFVHAYCTTSPLKIDTRSCDVLREALACRFPVNFAPMPILGGTAPVAPAAAAVVATAEILGCMTACTLIDPEVFYFATAISGEMDMRTTQVCYATPAAVLTDVILHQLFRSRYGLVLNVEPAYVEAKAPGIQAAWMKAFRQMAFGCTVSHSLPLGLLDNGAVFSPAQAMLDLDLNRAMYRFSQGTVIDEEALCLDLIREMEFCEKTSYLQTEHTAAHFRENLWDARYFDRTYRRSNILHAADEDRNVLRKADADWRAIVARQKDPEQPEDFLREVDRIVEAGKTELLAEG
ncbi:MAG: trimethylamine methyltransferase family protein [Pirellulales bacterium]|nr:trimethylamine methyltransferase family protein [Pirellulales bacterium]